MTARRAHWLTAAAILLLTPGSGEAIPPHYGEWETFDVSSGLPSNKTFAILATASDVWVGTDRGLARYSHGSWTTYGKSDGLGHDAVLALDEDEDTGDIWIATFGGLSRYSQGRIDNFTQLNSGLVNNVIYGVAVHEGEVWAATAAGTSRYEIAHDRWSIYDETNAPMHEIWCYSIAGDGNRVYVGVWGGGLLEFQRDRNRWKHYRDPDGEMEIDLFRNDGLVHDVISSVSVDSRSRIWIATYFGLSTYDQRAWINFFDHDSPLLSNFINFVQTRDEYCWIASDRGLNASDRENWWSYSRDPETGKGTATFHPIDGAEQSVELDSIFPHNYILGLSFRGDDLWVATEAGVAVGKLVHTRADHGDSADTPVVETSRE
jgi:ligand-binding sensor domain-containing protein